MNPTLKLESLERLGWRFGLDTVRALLEELGNPHLGLRCVHVAGSNGKGTVCAYLADYLRRSGFRTGLYTSPHLCDLRERFRIDGAWMPSTDLQRHSRNVLRACERVRGRLGHLPTHFEALTAIAFCWFREKKVDWAVLETGLGGRLDATNVIPVPALAVLTPIGLEHQDILGKGIPRIAREKAGILKEGGMGVTLQLDPRARQVLQRISKERRVGLWNWGREFRHHPAPGGFLWEGKGLRRRFRLKDPSPVRLRNAALSVAAMTRLGDLGVPIRPSRMQGTLLRSRWPGRFEVVRTSPRILVDGAHNPDGAKALASHLRSRYPGEKWVVLNGLLKDKDQRAYVGELASLAAKVVVTEPSGNRSGKGKQVLKAWERKGATAILVRDWRKALRTARKFQGRQALLVTGSLYLVGDCRKALVGLKGLARI